MHKVALITGAAKRIGACLCTSLHQQGFNIVLHYHHSKEAAENLAIELNQQRPNSVICLQASLDCNEQIQALAGAAIKCWGTLDVLINNASLFFPTEFDCATEQQWDALFNSNLKGAYFLSQALRNTLKAQQGCIINLIDIHAAKPLKNHSIYCMAKAGLVMMTKSLAAELAPEIRVNGISPGAILWPEPAAELNEINKQTILRAIPLARRGCEMDIAKTAVFLIKHAPYITGQIISVDGGKSLLD